MEEDQDKGMNRRDFIRKAAITGAVAWAVPAIQTVAATPASAQVNGTILCNLGRCVSTCTTNGCDNTDFCEGRCDLVCLDTGNMRCCQAACMDENWDGCMFAGCV